MLRNEGAHFRRRSNDYVDLTIEGKAQILRDLRIEGIDQRDKDSIVRMTNRKRSVKPGESGRE